jgi:hypothetical protein
MVLFNKNLEARESGYRSSGNSGRRHLDFLTDCILKE